MVSTAVLIFVLNVLSSVAALLTSYYAYKFYRIVRAALLASISIGFMLLGIGLAFEAFTSILSGRTVLEVVALRTLVGYSITIYLALQLIAYIIIAVGYAFSAYGKESSSLTTPLILSLQIPFRERFSVEIFMYTITMYFFATIVLAFIVFQGLLIHTRSKNRFSVLVLLAFALIFLAHVFFLVSVLELSEQVLIAGDFVQFAGFVSLLAFVIRSGSVGTG